MDTITKITLLQSYAESIWEIIVRSISPREHEIEREGELMHISQETRHGYFPKLETYLVEQLIPFDRYSEGGKGCFAEIRHYRPNECDVSIPLDNEDTPFLTVTDLERLLDYPNEYLAIRIREMVSEMKPQVSDLKNWVQVRKAG